jgi:DNA-binding MarR family transcriptional regulator
MTRTLAGLDLSGLEYHLLLATSAAGDDGIRQVELAQELSVPEARVSVLARHLGDRGLIEALRCEPDRRYVRLRVTAAGRALLLTAMRCQREQLVAMVGDLPVEGVYELIEHICQTYLGLDLEVRPRSG